MTTRTYTKQICEVMDLEAPPTIKAHPLRKSVVEFSRIASQRTDNGTLPTPVADAFLVSLDVYKPLPVVNELAFTVATIARATPRQEIFRSSISMSKRLSR